MGIKTIGRFTNESEDPEALSNDNGLVSISAPGAYLVEANVTYLADEASLVETRLLRNGSPVIGACATDDIDLAAGEASQAFSTVITVGCGQSAIINLEAVKAADICIANLIVVKLA